MIGKLKAFGWFWYDFIVGDDWLLAVGVLVILAATWIMLQIAAEGAWILLLLATLGVLYASVRRAAR